MVRFIRCLSAAFLLTLCSCGQKDGGFDTSSPYYFDGNMPREVLERYLDRSVTAGYLLVPGEPEGYKFPYREDDIRMVHNIGAKFIGRSFYRWGHESRLAEPDFVEQGRLLAARMHETDPEIIFQACLFEYVSPDVNNLPIPAWVFEAFGLPVEERCFNSREMVKRLDPSAEIRWGGNGGGVPMVNNQETQLWFYYLARTYIDMGCEALHLGQVELISQDDPQKEAYASLLAMIRGYASKAARRHYVLLDGHTPYGGFIKDGVSLLDFNSFPLRIKEVVDRPMEGILEVGYSDSIFKRSKGAYSPSGWYAESMPYLVEFDNFGTNGNQGVANLDDHFCWGYDDITWFATQSEEYRNKWLWYAFDWLRETDPNGHLQMCLIRMVTGDVGKTSMRSYFANTRSEACPVGYSQEETIKEIWETRLSGDYMKHDFMNPELPLEARLDDLMSRLTLEEKVGQMVNDAPAIARLGIPAYNWWNECLHGVARSAYNVTSFPQAIAMAATWDVDAVRQMAEYASDEGRAINNDARRKGRPAPFTGLTYWSPNINIFRDPRWGRGQETYGEDPYLTAVTGSAFVRGLQGDDPKYLKSSACAKHYAVHSGPEWNRHTFDAHVGPQDLWETYLPAFEALVTEAGVTGVMTAYNRFLGEGCSASDVLMNDILFGKWKYDGYVTSDCGAIDDLYLTHKIYPDAASGSADAVIHGTHCECGSRGSYLALVEAVERGFITEEEIDKAVRRLFEIRFRLGMFDPAEKVPYADIPLSVLECDKHKAHALKMAQESVVLLKNEDGLLPLSADRLRKVAVIGPGAAEEKVLLANYYGNPSQVKTVLEAVREKVGEGVEVVYEKGVNLVDDYVFMSAYDPSCFTFDGREGFGAEYFMNTRWEGGPLLVRHEEKVDYRWGDSAEIGEGVVTRHMSAIWRTVFTAPASGTYCFEVSADDRAYLIIDGAVPQKVGLIDDYYLLEAEAGKTYSLELRYVQNADNAEVKLDMGFLTRADCNAVASSVADADVIIYVGGLSPRIEGEEMPVEIEGFRRGDGTSIAMPKVQEDMLKALHATGKPVVFVLQTGRAVGLEWEAAELPAILCSWYGGQAGGEAVADVLFGDCNPSGKLPVTFYRDCSQLPDYEDYSMDGRTYRFFEGEPVYPFGYGLSYTVFKYEDMKAKRLSDGFVRLSVKVRNAGDAAGDEVVQVYASNPREFRTPIRSLKAFDRISLKPGEVRKVSFVLSPEDLSVVNEAGESVPMKGAVTLSVGGGQPGYCAECQIVELDY